MDSIKKCILKITPKTMKEFYQHMKVKWRFRGGYLKNRYRQCAYFCYDR